MTDIDGEPAMARASLVAVTKLARVLRRVGHRLKPVKDRASIKPLARRVTDQEIEPQMRHAMDMNFDTMRPRPTGAPTPTGVSVHLDGAATAPRSTSQPSYVSCDTDIPPPHSGFQQLDDCTALKHVSLLSLASNDHLLLQQHHYRLSVTQNVAQLRHVADVCTALLASLSHIPFQDEPPGSIGDTIKTHTHSSFALSNLNCGRIIANLEFLLLWYRQLALDAIVSHFLALAEKAVTYFFQHALMKKSALHDWFSEWPNGQRPLSTTWPWNIKPSLIVLWGVCWMFYAHRQATQAQGNPYSSQGQYGQDIWPGQAAANPHTQRQTGSSVSTGGSGPSYPSYSWLHAYEAGAGLRRASEVPAPGSPSVTSSILSTSASTFPYINVSSDEHSDLFSPASLGIWPQTSGINPAAAATAFDPGTVYWQTASNNATNFPNAPRNVITSPNYPPYVVPPFNEATTPQTTGAGPPRPSVSQASIHGVNAPTPRRNMQDYPSPQLSDISGQGDPSFQAFHSKMMASPSAVSILKSPSASGSSSSLRTIERIREPLRNAQGAFICDDLGCAHDPPTFARKCEWTKHMDKHIRPYICEEPGCESLRGFTYLGGLLRHQREVHRRHGGPRAACFCPHQDCKRSTGVGFSRKENLAEHLRRVHRDGAAQASAASQEMEQRPSQTLSNNGARKRRRKQAEASEEDEGPSSQSSQTLKQEVKKLKRELKEKDERLRTLEEQVKLLARKGSVQL